MTGTKSRDGLKTIREEVVWLEGIGSEEATQWDKTLLSETESRSGAGDGVGKGEGGRAGAGETELGDEEPKVARRTEAKLKVSPAGKVTT